MNNRKIAERLISYKKQICKHTIKDLLNYTQAFSSKNYCNNCYKEKRLSKYSHGKISGSSSYEYFILKAILEQEVYEKGISKMEKIIAWRHSNSPLLRKLSRVKL